MKEQAVPKLQFHPVTRERLPDLAQFSEHHGKFRYCSCMRWRMRSTEFRRSTKEDRVAALEALVCRDTPIGVLAYAAGEPVGWCSIAPRETYTLLEHSTTLKRIDDLPVWSVVCFFVDRRVRGQGLSVKLLRAAVDYAFSLGATIVEGYPAAPDQSYRFMGSPSVFHVAGFREVAVTEKGRRIVRFAGQDKPLCRNTSRTAKRLKSSGHPKKHSAGRAKTARR